MTPTEVLAVLKRCAEFRSEDEYDLAVEEIERLHNEVVMLKAKISNLEGQVAYRDGIAQI